ncbi:hypothetical protein E4U43_002777 [Claviceps pusilla]|uniref:Cytoplasmic Zn-finger protein BRAP2 (BRCA1 associated protein) n=1 Tax=Claviceps pusilla TaxID=123648 RepID=A0A9P7NFT0_9HYPO|nr:hypothetical protein E4U43_002777 [Claviceps pusilla]
MPYMYHLKFELYPTSDPTLSTLQQHAEEGIWLPPPDTSIFHDLPVQPRPDPSDHRHYHHQQQQQQQQQHRFGTASEQKWHDRPIHLSTLSRRATLRLQAAVKDWRFGPVSIQTVDPAAAVRNGKMSSESSRTGPSAAPSLGPSFGGAGTATKAEYVPLESKAIEVGWGIVHFYRENEEETANTGRENRYKQEQEMASSWDDCRTLCIPAVPAYMSPSDFLGFVGDGWRNELCHCRMVMTSRMNRYLALLNFRDSKVAQKWKREFDGKVFNSVEPQLCHVVFVKSITFETPGQNPEVDQPTTLQPSSLSTVSNSLRPFPPPTPSLIELPTCPVCLERMDETNGLMTVPCSHVFHCTCLQNWRGAGCPVCRFTNTTHPEGPEEFDANNPYSQPFGSSISNLCSECDCSDDLWICLICGYVGCGRYKGGHAKDHWKDTAHSFALELETQYVWDYAGDMWVHRLIRDKGDGKVVELPGRSTQNSHAVSEDVVPRAKMENIGLEYTHLITSQLESQRAYYEELISKAVDKAARASEAAESIAAASSSTMEKLSDLEEKYRLLVSETVPCLEKDLERERKKASKGEALARNMSRALQEEKRVNEGLLKRIEHLASDSEATKKSLAEVKAENADLKEMNRDLSMFISGQEKLKELETEGKIEEGELEGGSASVPERKKGRRRNR